MTRYEPEDKRPERCQCVMRHSDLKENAIPQCGKRRAKDSNLFCRDCEVTHGAHWRKLHPESVK